MSEDDYIERPKYEHLCDEYDKLESELSAMRQRAEAAEARIKASQEQEHVIQRMMCRLAELLDEDQFADMERLANNAGIFPPVTPPDVAELQGKIEYLESYIEAQKESFDEVAQANIEFQRAYTTLENVKNGVIKQRDIERHSYLEEQAKRVALSNENAELMARLGNSEKWKDNFELDAAKLRRENAELTRKLAEQQAINHGRTIVGWMRGYEFIPLPEFAKKSDVAVFTIEQNGEEELTKLLEEAKRQVVPAEDVFQNSKRYIARRKSIYLARARLQVSGSFKSEQEFDAEYDSSCDKNIDGYVIDGIGVWTKDAAMLASSPQPSPETDLDQAQRFK